MEKHAFLVGFRARWTLLEKQAGLWEDYVQPLIPDPEKIRGMFPKPIAGSPPYPEGKRLKGSPPLPPRPVWTLAQNGAMRRSTGSSGYLGGLEFGEEGGPNPLSLSPEGVAVPDFAAAQKQFSKAVAMPWHKDEATRRNELEMAWDKPKYERLKETALFRNAKGK